MTDWDRLVREYGATVFGTAWRILGHAADTEEVVQEVFFQAYRLVQTQEIRHWGSFLRRLAACRALDRLRQRKSFASLDPGLPGAESGPEEEAIGRELAERLRQAVAQLPRREATVFCLRYFDDLSYQEIAGALGIKTGAVAAALHKARARLGSLLAEATTGD